MQFPIFRETLLSLLVGCDYHVYHNVICLTLIQNSYKKYVAMRLKVIYDSQATNRKQGGLPVTAPPPAALLLVAWESYITPQLARIHKKTNTKR